MGCGNRIPGKASYLDWQNNHVLSSVTKPVSVKWRVTEEDMWYPFLVSICNRESSLHVCAHADEVCAYTIFTHKLNKTKQKTPCRFSGSMEFKIFNRITVLAEVNPLLAHCGKSWKGRAWTTNIQDRVWGGKPGNLVSLGRLPGRGNSGWDPGIGVKKGEDGVVGKS